MAEHSLAGLVAYGDSDSESGSEAEDEPLAQVESQEQPTETATITKPDVATITSPIHSESNGTTEVNSTFAKVPRHNGNPLPSASEEDPVTATIATDSTKSHLATPEPVPEDEDGIAQRWTRLLRPPDLPGLRNWGIPDEAVGECDPAIEQKVARFLSLKAQGMHFNDRLMRTHAFRNPSIMSKMIEFLGLDETGSNYVKDVFDPKRWPKEAFYDEMLKTQPAPAPAPPPVINLANNLTDPQLAKQIQKAQQRAIQFVSNINTSLQKDREADQDTSRGKRKSKWDHEAR
ncbi:HCNGP-like protein-domain-containing protein [Gaertneriomyces semiglobifer]|nr:HCNGP-like protein-domain-containing protein [Gaertneriomyces semiglobifer]